MVRSGKSSQKHRQAVPPTPRSVTKRYKGDTRVDGPQLGSLFISGCGPVTQPRVTMAIGTQLLNRFTLRRHLGEGRRGAVYLAEDALRGEEVAVKIMQVWPREVSRPHEHMVRELNVHGAVTDRRHVLRVNDMHPFNWRGGEFLLLSMQYADGGTFRQWLRRHAGDIDVRHRDGLRYFMEACSGVASAHADGVVHGDLKPENLLFVGDEVKVADFGAGSLVGVIIGRPEEGLEDLPRDWGTPTYMSPEHFAATRPDDIDFRADIYSLSVVLYELLHPKCRPPFVGPFERLRDLHLNVRPPALSGVPAFLARVVARGLEKNPHDRYESVRALVQDLHNGDVPRPAPASPEQDSWKRAVRCHRGGDFRGAMRHCREVIQAAPEHGEAKEMLEKLDTHYHDAQLLYETAESEMGGRSLGEVVGLVQEAMGVFPGHPAARVVLKRLSTQAREYRLQMEMADEALQQGQWNAGLDHLRRAQDLNSAAPGLAQSIGRVTETIRRIEELRGHINNAVSSRNRRWAVSLARLLDRYVADVLEQIRHGNGEEA